MSSMSSSTPVTPPYTSKPTKLKQFSKHWKKIKSIDAFLGQGSFGKVVKVRHKTTNKVYAMKKIAKTEKIYAYQEINIMNNENLQSEYLLNLVDVVEEKNSYCLIMDLMEMGSLRKFIDSGLRLSELGCVGFTFCVLKGLIVLHNNNIIHRDLKPANILITESGSITIADFGLAKFLDVADENIEHTIAGTPHFQSPEIWERMYTHKADIWSLGMMLAPLLDVLSLETIYKYKQNAAIQRHSKKYATRILNTVEKRYKLVNNYLKFCLVEDPEERKSSAELLEVVGNIVKAQKIGRIAKIVQYCEYKLGRNNSNKKSKPKRKTLKKYKKKNNNNKNSNSNDFGNFKGNDENVIIQQVPVQKRGVRMAVGKTVYVIDGGVEIKGRISGFVAGDCVLIKFIPVGVKKEIVKKYPKNSKSFHF